MTDILVSNFIYILEIVQQMLLILVIASAVCSWVGADPYNPIVRMINNSTEPLFRPFRRLTARFNATGLDLAPFLFLLTMMFTFRVVIQVLQRFAI